MCDHNMVVFISAFSNPWMNSALESSSIIQSSWNNYLKSPINMMKNVM